MSRIQFRYLSMDDIAVIPVDDDEIMEVISDVLLSHQNGLTEMPPKIGIYPSKESFIHAMPANIKDLKSCGVKWVSSYKGNIQRGLPRVAGLIILNDPENGLPICIMECSMITMKRTAALSALFSKNCVAGPPRTLTILGAGMQAISHTTLFSAVFPSLDTVNVFDISAISIKKYIDGISSTQLKINEVASVEEAVNGGDIIFSGGIQTPVIHLEWIKPGAVGISLDMGRAWCADVIEGIDMLVTDDANQLWRRYGDDKDAFQSNPILYGELGEIIHGTKAARLNAKQRILFIITGISINDIALAYRYYQKAIKADIGKIIDL